MNTGGVPLQPITFLRLPHFLRRSPRPFTRPRHGGSLPASPGTRPHHLARPGPMSRRRLLMLSGLVLLSGCLYHVRERTDQVVGDLVAHPFDLGPAEKLGTTESRPADEKAPMPRPAGGTAPGAKTALPP